MLLFKKKTAEVKISTKKATDNISYQDIRQLFLKVMYKKDLLPVESREALLLLGRGKRGGF